MGLPKESVAAPGVTLCEATCRGWFWVPPKATGPSGCAIIGLPKESVPPPLGPCLLAAPNSWNGAEPVGNGLPVVPPVPPGGWDVGKMLDILPPEPKLESGGAPTRLGNVAPVAGNTDLFGNTVRHAGYAVYAGHAGGTEVLRRGGVEFRECALAAAQRICDDGEDKPAVGTATGWRRIYI